MESPCQGHGTDIQGEVVWSKGCNGSRRDAFSKRTFHDSIVLGWYGHAHMHPYTTRHTKWHKAVSIHHTIKSILTSKRKPSPTHLLELRGNFIRTNGVQEQGALPLTRNQGPYGEWGVIMVTRAMGLVSSLPSRDLWGSIVDVLTGCQDNSSFARYHLFPVWRRPAIGHCLQMQTSLNKITRM